MASKMNEVARRFNAVSFDVVQDFENQQQKMAKASSNTVVVPDSEKFPFLRLPKDRPFIRVDILPFLMKTENGIIPLSRYNYYIHRNVGPGYASVVCPQHQLGKPCPVCEFRKTLDYNSSEDQSEYKRYRTQTRQLYALYWLDAPEEDRYKIHILDTSEYGFGRLLNEKIKSRDMADPVERNWNMYADLLEGHTLKLNLCDQTFQNTKYRAVSAIDIKPRENQYSEDLYDGVPDLSKCLVILSYSEIKEKMSGVSVENGPSEMPEVPVTKEVTEYDLTNGYHPIVEQGTESFPDTNLSPVIAKRTHSSVGQAVMSEEDYDVF